MGHPHNPQPPATPVASPLRLEPLAAGHYPAIVELWEAAVRATHGFLAETDIAGIRAALPAAYLPAVALFGALDGQGRLLGFAGTAGDVLEMLFVAPDWHRRGVGSQLLRHAVEQLGICRVDVNEQNPAATAFYLAHGFRQRGRSATDGAGRPYPLLHLELSGDAQP